MEKMSNATICSVVLHIMSDANSLASRVLASSLPPFTFPKQPMSTIVKTEVCEKEDIDHDFKIVQILF